MAHGDEPQRTHEGKVMRTLFRRWFGLRCAVIYCPRKYDREHGMLIVRCADCGQVRGIIN